MAWNMARIYAHNNGDCDAATCPLCEIDREALRAYGVVDCECGQTADGADCPDRHRFEDHCVECMDTCDACQHRLDDGEA